MFSIVRHYRSRRTSLNAYDPDISMFMTAIFPTWRDRPTCDKCDSTGEPVPIPNVPEAPE
jgi:hypothetical protein